MKQGYIAITCVLSAFLLAYLEYRRTNKKHLGWRVAAVIIAVAALGCLIYPLTYQTSKLTALGSKILLTEGFNKDSINSNDSLFTIDPAIHHRYPKTRLLSNVSELNGSTSATRILGYGLNEVTLNELKADQITFSPSPLPDGFTDINWPRQIKAGQPLEVQGVYHNTTSKKLKLILRGLNTGLDSVILAAHGDPPFSLKTSPKNSGRVVYSLTVTRGRDTILKESIPVVIEPRQPAKVLILSASPDFEARFLRDWLGSNGYAVASRTNFTMGKIGQDFKNMERVDLANLTAGTFNKFDVVIGDLSALSLLTAAETSALQNEVSEKGLGLIVRADSSDKKSAAWLMKGFRVDQRIGKPSLSSTLNIPGKGKTAKLYIDPDYLVAQSNNQTLVNDEHGHALASVTLNGSGRIIFSTIHHTYSWVLAGNNADYSMVWSTLLDKALRKTPQAGNWSVKSQFPRVNEPVELVSETLMQDIQVTINSNPVYPAQNPAMPFQQLYTYWPAKYGWQKITRSNSKPYWWFAWKNGDWKTLDAAGKVAATRKFVNDRNAPITKKEQSLAKSRVPIPKFYFFILFLMAATYLWAERKFWS